LFLASLDPAIDCGTQVGGAGDDDGLGRRPAEPPVTEGATLEDHVVMQADGGRPQVMTVDFRYV